MYLIHKWWARKPHNVVAEYIEKYSKKGDIILDPFCGSGVTNAESLRLKRKTVGFDIDPIATFITRMTITYADLKKIEKAFKIIEVKVKKDIEKLYETKCPSCGKNALALATIWDRDKNQELEIRLYCPYCDDKHRKKPDEYDIKKLQSIEKTTINYWYPKDKLYYENGRPFKKKEINEQISDLFTKRALIALSRIYHEIETIEIDELTRDFLKFSFTSRVHIASNMGPVAKPSPRSHWTEDSTTSF
jgi:adenine-specific DNA methylase